ncbi:MAG: Ig-like domain-containing protein [Prevotellaceae bacterium]|nr:Ig-like domain-containing protein [Prevotellaceae bacterium]
MVLFTGRCANVAQGPEGGPKDSIPPVLLTTIPEYLATNQKPKRIKVVFNEYVQIKDAAKNVTVSPPSLRRPIVRTRGKGIEVRFEDTLRTNTTYTIDFGESISDLNEGIPFSAFRYVFSTGAAIDSMMLTGKVFDAFTREPLPKTVVCLYENHSDTAIYKTLPSAIARTDQWGYFTLQNIKPVAYHMVAFDDKNNNYRYDPGAEMLAFEDSLVIPDKIVDYEKVLEVIEATDTVRLLARDYQKELYAFNEDVGKQFLKEHTLSGTRKLTLAFNRRHAGIISFQLNGVDSSNLVRERNRFNDTIIYWITAPVVPDTLQAEITYIRTDSLDMLSPFTTKLKFQKSKKEEEQEQEAKNKKDKDKKDEEEKKETLTPSISYAAENIMKNGVTFGFNSLPTTVDPTLIRLWYVDDVDKQQKEETFTWVSDSIKIRQFYLHAKWKVGSQYELLALPGAFADVYGLTNDSISKKITTDDPDKYSSIRVNLTGIDNAQQIIVQLLDEKKTRVLREAIVIENKKLQFDYLKAGTYTLRLIEDKNKNGIWDPGNYLEKRQYEPVEFYALPGGSEIITLLENTEINQDIDAKQVFARDRRKEIPLLEEEHGHDHEHGDEDEDEHGHAHSHAGNGHPPEVLKTE